MPFKKKSYRKVGDIYIPRPPTGATHIFFQNGSKKKATVGIRDVDTLLGSVGTIKYVKLDHKNKLVKTFDKEYNWDGEKVKGLA